MKPGRFQAARWAGPAAGFAIAALAALLPSGGQAVLAEGDTVSVPGRPAAPDRTAPRDEAEQLLAAHATSRAIDREIMKVLEAEGVPAAGTSDDAEFLRRVYLDILGVPPTEAELRAFIASKDPGRRQVLIERLLHDPVYGEHMADQWGKVLFAGLRRYRYQEKEALKDWLAGLFNEGRGLDHLAREVITATGDTTENPALGYIMRFRDGGIPADVAGTTSRIFLGVQIQCAQCHNHPYERWTMEDFAGVASFFNFVQPRRTDPMDPRAGFTVNDPTPRELDRRGRRGGTGADIRGAASADPKFLAGAVYDDVPGATRRGALAEWITARDNPWFAKAMANRTWSWFFGRGLVSPVDDFRSDNVPSHPEILNTLALGFAESGYDLRFLVRAITLSETYQRTSVLPKGLKRDDVEIRRADRLYARGPVKPLTADQVFDSVLRATGMDDAFRRTNRREIEGIRQALFRQFVTELDDDETAETEQWAGTIPQGLLLMNGPLTAIGSRAGGPHGRLDRIGVAARQNTLNEILDQVKDTAARVQRLYLTTLGRFPTDREVSAAAAFASRGKGNQGWEDLFWALLNSSEFMSNH